MDDESSVCLVYRVTAHSSISCWSGHVHKQHMTLKQAALKFLWDFVALAL